MKRCPECGKEMKFTTDEGNLLYLCHDCHVHEVDFDEGLARFLETQLMTSDIGEDIAIDDRADRVAEVVALYYHQQGVKLLPSPKAEQDAIDSLRAKGFIVFTEAQMKQATIDTFKDLKERGLIK